MDLTEIRCGGRCGWNWLGYISDWTAGTALLYISDGPALNLQILLPETKLQYYLRSQKMSLPLW
jgi:hypothetical protein